MTKRWTDQGPLDRNADIRFATSSDASAATEWFQIAKAVILTIRSWLVLNSSFRYACLLLHHVKGQLQRILDPHTALQFIEGYKKLLLEIGVQAGYVGPLWQYQIPRKFGVDRADHHRCTLARLESHPHEYFKFCRGRYFATFGTANICISRLFVSLV